jgi:hypothetical protein
MLWKIMNTLMIGVMGIALFLPGVAVAQTQTPAPTPTPAAETVRTAQSHVDAVPAAQTDTRTFLPLLANNRCGSALNYAKNHFGVQAYGYLGATSPFYCELVDSGATWVRNEIAWESVEPQDLSPAVYNWTTTDQAMETARRGGFNLIVTINRNPVWAATYLQGPIDKVPLTRFSSFVGALVERYDGDGIDDAPGSPKVEHWEFYNEPDAGSLRNDNRWGDFGKEYAQMLAAVYPVVKAANPDAKVLLGGIAYDWFEEQDGPFVREFLDDVLKNGGGQYIDIMNFHQYPPFAANWGAPNGPGLVEKADAIRAKLAEYGLEKPLVVSESGMHSNNASTSPMTPEFQARYVTMLFSQVLAADVDTLVWFMLYDPGETYPFRNGLVTYGTASGQRPERKPAFVAYQTAVTLLAGATFERALTAAETGSADLIAYKNVDQNGQVLYVVWLGPITRTDTAPLSVPGSLATVLDIYGAARTVADADDGQVDGKIALAIGAQPVYVRIQQ